MSQKLMSLLPRLVWGCLWDGRFLYATVIFHWTMNSLDLLCYYGSSPLAVTCTLPRSHFSFVTWKWLCQWRSPWWKPAWRLQWRLGFLEFLQTKTSLRAFDLLEFYWENSCQMRTILFEVCTLVTLFPGVPFGGHENLLTSLETVSIPKPLAT